MKICHYNNNQAGVVVGDQAFNIGDALIKAGLARQGYTMLEMIDALADNSKAMDIARIQERHISRAEFDQVAGADPKSGIALGRRSELLRASGGNGRARGQREQGTRKQ